MDGLQDVTRKRDELRSLNLAETSWHDAEAMMRRFGEGYMFLSKQHFMPSAYRARLNEGSLFETVGELWAPPPDRARVNRFNRRGEPVLYLAGSAPASLYEIHARVGQPATILVCGMQANDAPLRTAAIGLEYFAGGPINGELSPHIQSGLRGVPEFRAELQRRGILDTWCVQDDYFAEVSTAPGRSSHQYKLTIPIWASMIEPKADIDGLVYPSVQTSRRAFNIALKLDRATCVRPLEAWVVEPQRMEVDPAKGDYGFSAAVLRRGRILADHTMDWGKPGEWSLDEVYMEFAGALQKRGETGILKNMVQGSRYQRTVVTFGGYSRNS